MPDSELAALKASMLQEIRDDVKAMRGEFTSTAVFIGRMDERVSSLEKSRNWLYGTMTTLCLTVVGVILKLVSDALS